MKIVYVVHTTDGLLEVRKKFDNTKIVLKNILRQVGFASILKEDLEDINDMHESVFMELSGEYTDLGIEYLIDSGKEGQPGYAWLSRKEV